MVLAVRHTSICDACAADIPPYRGHLRRDLVLCMHGTARHVPAVRHCTHASMGICRRCIPVRQLQRHVGYRA